MRQGLLYSFSTCCSLLIVTIHSKYMHTICTHTIGFKYGLYQSQLICRSWCDGTQKYQAFSLTTSKKNQYLCLRGPLDGALRPTAGPWDTCAERLIYNMRYRSSGLSHHNQSLMYGLISSSFKPVLPELLVRVYIFCSNFDSSWTPHPGIRMVETTLNNLFLAYFTTSHQKFSIS